MLLRSLFFISLIGLGQAGAAQSDEGKLNQVEIKRYLDGKTVVHRPGGKTEFRQTFNADGTTTYKAAGRQTEQGKWSIQGDQYCSQWGPFGWTCYDMTAKGNLITWISKEGVTYPGMLLPE